MHAFGAYFGMAITVVMSRKNYDKAGSEKNDTTVTSDIFSLLGETENCKKNAILFRIVLLLISLLLPPSAGSLLLWLYWPSFNGLLAEADARHRA